MHDEGHDAGELQPGSDVLFEGNGTTSPEEPSPAVLEAANPLPPLVDAFRFGTEGATQGTAAYEKERVHI